MASWSFPVTLNISASSVSRIVNSSCAFSPRSGSVAVRRPTSTPGAASSDTENDHAPAERKTRNIMVLRTGTEWCVVSTVKKWTTQGAAGDCLAQFWVKTQWFSDNACGCNFFLSFFLLCESFIHIHFTTKFKEYLNTILICPYSMCLGRLARESNHSSCPYSLSDGQQDPQSLVHAVWISQIKRVSSKAWVFSQCNSLFVFSCSFSLQSCSVEAVAQRENFALKRLKLHINFDILNAFLHRIWAVRFSLISWNCVGRGSVYSQ